MNCWEALSILPTPRLINDYNTAADGGELTADGRDRWGGTMIARGMFAAYLDLHYRQTQKLTPSAAPRHIASPEHRNIGMLGLIIVQPCIPFHISPVGCSSGGSPVACVGCIGRCRITIGAGAFRWKFWIRCVGPDDVRH